MYFVMRSENLHTPDSADVVLEEGDGFTFICDCGDWKNDQARATAEKICSLLNRELQDHKYLSHVIARVNVVTGDLSGRSLSERKVSRIKALRNISLLYPEWDVERAENGMIRLWLAKDIVENNWED